MPKLQLGVGGEDDDSINFCNLRLSTISPIDGELSARSSIRKNSMAAASPTVSECGNFILGKSENNFKMDIMVNRDSIMSPRDSMMSQNFKIL